MKTVQFSHLSIFTHKSRVKTSELIENNFQTPFKSIDQDNFK
jgi:hypothetical protein